MGRANIGGALRPIPFTGPFFFLPLVTPLVLLQMLQYIYSSSTVSSVVHTPTKPHAVVPPGFDPSLLLPVFAMPPHMRCQPCLPYLVDAKAMPHLFSYPSHRAAPITAFPFCCSVTSLPFKRTVSLNQDHYGVPLLK
jgi:hypothetical protein